MEGSSVGCFRIAQFRRMNGRSRSILSRNMEIPLLPGLSQIRIEYNRTARCKQLNIHLLRDKRVTSRHVS